MHNNFETLGNFLDTGDLWGSIEVLKPFPFFADYPALLLNDFTDLTYGRRVLFSKFNTVDGLDIASAAQFIVMKYSDKWDALIAVNSIDFDYAASETEKKVEVSSNNELGVRTSETVNKVSAYNSEEMVADGGTTVTNNDDIDREGNKTTTTGKQSLKSAWDNLTMTEKTGIIQTITGDVAGFLSLETY